MRVMVTGRTGQVARSLLERASSEVEIVAIGRPELDLAGPASNIQCAINSAMPDLIVSAAAYTQVDQAEREPQLAFAVNRDGPRALASAAQTLAIPMIHLSTDYVFSGTKPTPYDEADEPGPTGIYGASKLAGEQAVLAEHNDVVIVRTAWVYSPFGSNFVKTMLRLAKDRREIGIVCDQHGNPTSALDIADGILRVASNLHHDSNPALRGLFHMAATGEADWSQFAQSIFELSAEAGGPSALVKPISTADYPTPARRPANSRLNCDALERVHEVRLPDWHSSLTQVVQRLVQGGA